jgi:2-haloalkanoic acid dehalogenase type II
VAQPYEVVTFDCYGTLIDWQRGIRSAFAATAATLRVPVDTARAVALYLEIEPTVEAGPFRPYREVLTETARQVAARLGWRLPEAHAGFLAESIPHWPPFSETNRALLRLNAAGYQLGILSNVDDDVLKWTRRHFAVPFDIVITAEEVGSYMPAPGHFEAARRIIGDRPWLHAAQSYFHDVVPARTLNIPVAWINRNRQTAGADVKPDFEFPALTPLADWLAPVAGADRAARANAPMGASAGPVAARSA